MCSGRRPAFEEFLVFLAQNRVRDRKRTNIRRPNGRNINENDQKPYLLAGFPLGNIGAYVRACSVAVSGKRSCPGDFQPPPDPYVSYIPGRSLSLFEVWLLLGFGPEV